MATYEINVSAAKTAASQLEEIIGTLRIQMNQLNDIEKTLLNDSLWKGPNKTAYTRNFEEYKASLNLLYTNAVDHLTKLNEIIQVYQSVETN